MAQVIASDMARQSLAVLLQKVEAQCAFSAEEGREFLTGCEIGSLLLERLWQLAQSFLDRGMEGRRLSFLLKELLDVIAVGKRVFEVASEKIKLTDFSAQECADAESLLGRFDRRAAEMQEKFAALVQWLETPPPAIDEAALPSGRGQQGAQGYVSHEELTTRLLSGDNT